MYLFLGLHCEMISAEVIFRGWASCRLTRSLVCSVGRGWYTWGALGADPCLALKLGGRGSHAFAARGFCRDDRMLVICCCCCCVCCMFVWRTSLLFNSYCKPQLPVHYSSAGTQYCMARSLSCAEQDELSLC